MTGQPMSAWRLILRSYPCDTCGAAPGGPCLTPSGNHTQEHAARARLVHRCPKCGARVDADEPGELCPRCVLLRDLNTERATTWKRHHP